MKLLALHILLKNRVWVAGHNSSVSHWLWTRESLNIHSSEFQMIALLPSATAARGVGVSRTNVTPNMCSGQEARDSQLLGEELGLWDCNDVCYALQCCGTDTERALQDQGQAGQIPTRSSLTAA